MVGLSRSDTALARHRAYLLIGRLYSNGLTEGLLPHISNIPELADVSKRPFATDEAAANHHAIFAHDILPYESIFRDPSRLLGSRYASRVNEFYQEYGMHISSDHDHIGQELTFLSTLCLNEFQAINGKDDESVHTYENIQRSFLREHLLHWLHPFAIALSFSGQAFYAALGELTKNLVQDHFFSISYTGSIDQTYISEGFDQPELLDLLQNEETSLKQVATFLITPPYCGFYIGRNAIADLARDHKLPRGFGNRLQMLANLFHAAAQYELMPDLIEKLANLANNWVLAYEKQMKATPELGEWIQPWRQRAQSAASALSIMKKLSNEALS